MDWLELLANLADIAPDDREPFRSRPDPTIRLDLRDELELVTEAAARAAKRSPEEAGDLLATVLVGLPVRKFPPVDEELL